MKIILLGDSCSGKTTVLKMLQEKGYPVVFEEGLKRIPPEVEGNKLQSNLWFTKYYHERDRTLPLALVILEYCLQFQYPFTEAQFQSGKITQEQREIALQLLDQHARDIPLEKETRVIHLVCSPEQIIERLQLRQMKDDAKQIHYRNILRHATEQYFGARCIYHKIDTSNLSPEEVYNAIVALFSQENIFFIPPK